MNPTSPETLRNPVIDERHRELSRRMRGVRFARMHYRMAVAEPFMRREEIYRQPFAFRRS